MKWQEVKNLLCVRLDNMGDVLMSTPAMAAIKKTLGCRLTLLTSTNAKPICAFIPEIDEVMIFDAPWVKSDAQPSAILACIDQLKLQQFDGAIIFTVFSQNPLPAAMLTYLAGISCRLAFCRENPYHLLTDWIPDDEPYSKIRHQVERDLFLVEHIGARTEDLTLRLQVNESFKEAVIRKMRELGIDLGKPWIVLHPAVSEKKREYPVEDWITIGEQLILFGFQLVITGPATASGVATEIHRRIGKGSFVMTGDLSIGELIVLISEAPLVISVNTSVVHIAAAVKTEVIVLYAETNPQHVPWMVTSRIFTFPVAPSLRSRNEVLRFIQNDFTIQGALTANASDVVEAAISMLQ